MNEGIFESLLTASPIVEDVTFAPHPQKELMNRLIGMLGQMPPADLVNAFDLFVNDILPDSDDEVEEKRSMFISYAAMSEENLARVLDVVGSGFDDTLEESKELFKPNDPDTVKKRQAALRSKVLDTLIKMTDGQLDDLFDHFIENYVEDDSQLKQELILAYADRNSAHLSAVVDMLEAYNEMFESRIVEEAGGLFQPLPKDEVKRRHQEGNNTIEPLLLFDTEGEAEDMTATLRENGIRAYIGRAFRITSPTTLDTKTPRHTLSVHFNDRVEAIRVLNLRAQAADELDESRELFDPNSPEEVKKRRKEGYASMDEDERLTQLQQDLIEDIQDLVDEKGYGEVYTSAEISSALDYVAEWINTHPISEVDESKELFTPNSEEEVAKRFGESYPLFKKYCNERWPGRLEKEGAAGYLSTWADRFARGEEWAYSDYAGRRALQKIAPDQYPKDLDGRVEDGRVIEPNRLAPYNEE